MLKKRKELLVILLLMVIAPGCDGVREPCLRDYTFTGVVTDSGLSPLSGVEVSLTGTYGETFLTTTGGDGKYTSATTPGRVAYSGARVKFVKVGYQTAEVEPFTETEAGRDVCGTIVLRRDAVLQPL